MITRSILLSEEKMSEFDLKKVNMNEETPVVRFNYITPACICFLRSDLCFLLCFSFAKVEHELYYKIVYYKD